MDVNMKKTFVYVTFIKEGYHCYPDANIDPLLATGDKYDVSHLAHKHMHYFYFKVWVSVAHNNRHIEFIQFRRWLEQLYDNNTLQLDNMSCEMICDSLHLKIHEKYPNSEIRIDVSEDNINGSYVEYQPI
jgi:hypothetical protein